MKRQVVLPLDKLASNKTNQSYLPINDLPYHDFGDALRTPKTSSAHTNRTNQSLQQRSASVPPPSDRFRGTIRQYEHRRRDHPRGYATTHCGSIPKAITVNPIDTEMHNNVLRQNGNDVMVMGYLVPEWDSYRAADRADPGKTNYGHKQRGQGGKMPLRIVPGCYIGETFAPVGRHNFTSQNRSTSKHHFEAPHHADWTKRYAPFKDGIPYRDGKGFDVHQQERLTDTVKKEKKEGTYYGGIPQRWNGGSTRCEINDTYRNGQRPHILDGGLPPEEYKHFWPQKQKAQKNMIPCPKAPNMQPSHANPLCFSNQSFSVDAMKKQPTKAFTIKCSGPRDRSTELTSMLGSFDKGQPMDIAW